MNATPSDLAHVALAAGRLNPGNHVGQPETAECPMCNGLGAFTYSRTVPACCNQPLRTGECCGNAVPELEQYQEPCEGCNGTGRIPVI